MKTINAKSILNNDYDEFRNDFYNTLKQKYDENPIAVEFNNRIKNNGKIHEYIDVIKGNIKYNQDGGLLGSPKQMLFDNKN